MKNYLILLCFAAFITLHGMQKDIQLPMYAIKIVDSNTCDVPRLEQFAKTQQSNASTKKILIINDKQEFLSINDYISPIYTPEQVTLHNIDFSQYSLALYMIKATAYNHTTNKKFDALSEKAIDLLANSNLKTHYYILPPHKSDTSPILDRIDKIYLQADAKKIELSQQSSKQNTVIAALFKHCKQCKQRLSRLIASLGKKMTSTPFLCLIIRLVDHPDFPLPSVQPFILQGLPLIIMLKTFLA